MNRDEILAQLATWVHERYGPALTCRWDEYPGDVVIIAGFKHQVARDMVYDALADARWDCWTLSHDATAIYVRPGFTAPTR